MSKSAMIHARVEPEIKKNVEEIFAELGLNMTSALNLFFKQVVLQKGLPFSVNIPNTQTAKAIEEARKTVKKKSRFSSADEMFAALDED
jgi:DNA-damage-inducible protein J